MALIRYAEGQQRSGSIGATVYSHNRYGAYIRPRTVPVNPNTDRQVAVRNAMRALTIHWNNTLTTTQRDAWKVYGDVVTWYNKFGDPVNLTGLAHYIRSNTISLALGKARIDDAPVIFNLAAAELALAATASEATQQITISYDDTEVWATEAGAYQFFYMGIPQNFGKAFFNGPYRYVNLADGATPAVSPGVFAAPFPIAAAQRLWIRSRIMRADGRLSEFAQFNFPCAA
jgi:hypothetical protein